MTLPDLIRVILESPSYETAKRTIAEMMDIENEEARAEENRNAESSWIGQD